MRHLILTLLSLILFSCKGEYDDQYKEVLDKRLDGLFEYKILESKQITHKELGQFKEHHVKIQFTAKQHLYINQGSNLVNYATESLKELPEQYRPKAGRSFSFFRSGPDLTKLFKEYSVLRPSMKTGDTVVAMVEFASQSYDDGSLKMEKRFNVKEILEGNFLKADISSSGSLTSYDGKYVIVNTPEVQKTIDGLIQQSKIMIKEYEDAEAEKKRIAEEKAKQAREERERKRLEAKQAYEAKVKARKDAQEALEKAKLQEEIDKFNSKVAVGKTYQGIFKNPYGKKEVSISFTKNENDGEQVEIMITFIENDKFFIKLNGSILKKGSEMIPDYKYLSLITNKYSIPTDSKEGFWKQLKIYLNDNYKSVFNLAGESNSLKTSILQHQSHANNYYKWSIRGQLEATLK